MHYAKGQKPYSKGSILTPFIGCSRMSRTIGTTSRFLVARGWGGGERLITKGHGDGDTHLGDSVS